MYYLSIQLALEMLSKSLQVELHKLKQTKQKNLFKSLLFKHLK